MKQLFSQYQQKAKNWLLSQTDLLSKTESIRLLSANGSITKNAVEDNSIGQIAILNKSMYVTFERSYKVISRKELLGIVNNEKDFHSPFSNSFVQYKVEDAGDGTWLVTYYFVDLDVFPHVANYHVVLTWEWVLVAHLESLSTLPCQVTSVFGEHLVVSDGQRNKVTELDLGNLKSRILLGNQPNLRCETLTLERMSDAIANYFLSFTWVGIQGSFNRQRLFANSKKVSFSKYEMAAVAALFVGVMALESAYLVGTDYLLSKQVSESAEARNEYASLKGQYLTNLDAYQALEKAIKTRSHAAALPSLLGQLQTDYDLRIDRLDYVEGEVRIGGISGDIESLMSFLGKQASVSGLDFLSPITPDKSGKDRFSIRFDFLDE